MDNSAYITLSRQMVVFRDLDVTANNIANVDTIGFQGEKLIFDDYLVRERTAEDRGNIAFARDPMSHRDTTEGRVQQTGNPLDMAVRGNGYFQVETPLGVRYTKAGNFHLNAEGIIVTTAGNPVLAEGGGQITIPQDAVKLEVLANGTVKVDDEDLGRIALAEFQNPQGLERVGKTMFKSDEGPLPGAAQSTIMQGHLERSNVNGITEMTRLIKLQRSVGTTAKFIETGYDLQSKVGDAYTRNMSN